MTLVIYRILRRWRNLRTLLCSCLLFLVGCATSNQVAATKSTLLFDLLKENPQKDQPLLGSFDEGAKAFKNADGKSEAETVYKSKGPQFIYFCGHSCQPEGLKSTEEIRQIVSNPRFGRVDIPASSDVWNSVKRPYYEASLNYSRAFNSKMFELANGPK